MAKCTFYEAAAVDHPGTSIVSAVKLLATQVVTTYHLDPDKTVFLEYTPPQSGKPEFLLAPDDELKPLERLLSTFFGVSEERFERIFFRWSLSHHTESSERYASDAQWEALTPKVAIELFRLVE